MNKEVVKLFCEEKGMTYISHEENEDGSINVTYSITQKFSKHYIEQFARWQRIVNESNPLHPSR